MPRSLWSPAEAAVHVLQLLRTFQVLARGGTSPYARDLDFASTSGELIAAEPERDVGTLAAAIHAETRAWVAASRDLPRGGTPFSWHGHVDISAGAASGILLGELLLHGRDIATAARHPWPLAQGHARTVLVSILPLLPLVVDEDRAAGVHLAYDVRVRGLPPLRFAFDGARLTISSAGGGLVDAHLAGDAVAVLLVAYGRWSHWQAIARGRLRAWGGRPWTALRFTSLLRNP